MGDGHLKNYGVLYTNPSDVHLSPMFDVVTTAVYRYQRYDGGPELEDKTMALKLFAGKNQTKTYPVKEELMRFGRDICGVKYPEQIVDRIAQSMQETMQIAKSDDRIPTTLLQQMSQNGMKEFDQYSSFMEYKTELAVINTDRNISLTYIFINRA